jgi:6-pyruvoyltetrahydropterin/6-carboxytetrahydropterin synthase
MSSAQEKSDSTSEVKVIAATGKTVLITKISAVRKLQFCAGHRVYKHESKCAHLHGHNYLVYIHAQAKDDAEGEAVSQLDALGRVIDFSVLKEKFSQWIEQNWDHGFILWQEDLEAIAAMKTLPGQKLFLLGKNPTAENLAHYLLAEVAPVLLRDTGVKVVKIVLWETENCFVEVAHAGY